MINKPATTDIASKYTEMYITAQEDITMTNKCAKEDKQSIIINDNIEVTIAYISGQQIRVGVTTPKEMNVYRKKKGEKTHENKCLDHDIALDCAIDPEFKKFYYSRMGMSYVGEDEDYKIERVGGRKEYVLI
jgi:carbon storage regulator CsrA